MKSLNRPQFQEFAISLYDQIRTQVYDLDKGSNIIDKLITPMTNLVCRNLSENIEL